MRHTELSLRRPVTVSMIFAALFAVGLISSRLLPLEEFPDIDWPGFFVNIPYEGSTPKETERQITRPAEEALATLPGVKDMYSWSNENSAEIWMEYGFNSNARTAAVEARVKLDAIRDQLPADLERIQVFSGSMSDRPIMQLRVSSDRDLSNAYNLLNTQVRRRLERLEGVSKVTIQGVEPPEVRLRLDAGRVRAHNVNLAELADLLRRSNFAVSGGQITSSNERWTLRPNGEFKSLEDIRDLVIDDGNLRLRDVAEVSITSQERDYGRHLDGNYAIGIEVSRASGYNMVEVSDRVKEEVRLIGETPAMRGIEIFDLENQAESVRQSLADLIKSGAIGALLAIVVLYFFLRHMATTLIVTLSVPLSLVITLGAMYFAGLSLNVLTLMGLMLAIGMLVDNSVVITESIFRYRQENGSDPTAATLLGVREVGLAVIASTTTSVCVFLPIVFSGESELAVFIRHVAITISVAIICSLLVAQTLIPLLASKLKTIPKEHTGRLIPAVAKHYKKLLHWITYATGPKRLVAPLVALLLLASPYIPIKSESFKVDPWPEEPSRRLFLPFHLNDIYSLEQVEANVDRIEQFLFENEERFEIRSVYSYWNQGEAQTTILLTQGADAKTDSREIMKMILDEKPDIAIGEPAFERPESGFGEGFSITITGESTERLRELTYDAWDLLENVEGLSDFSSDLTAGPREVRIRLDREKAAAVGVNAQAVGNAVGIALRGERLREFRSQDGEVLMRLAFRDDDRQSIQSLSNMMVPATDSLGNPTSVPLYQVATLEQTRGARTIRRTNRKTSASLSAAIAQGTSMDELKPEVQKVMDQLQLPAGYQWNFGRGFERNDETKDLMLENILLGVILIVIVMAAMFESMLYPLSIIMSLIYSLVGVIWFLALTNTPLTFMGMVGLMILIGVVVNNGIVLVDHINNLRSEGLTRSEAVVEGAADRFRPILMTAATTILGLVPLAIGDTQVGAGGPAYYPMARTIIGGLAFSTIVSLIVVPMTYVGLDKFKNWSHRVWRHATRRKTSGHRRPALSQ
ncbi:MAG: efflux RND transporter permease subunit [Pseudomonadota bacterium]